jgi:hypothetical protein
LHQYQQEESPTQLLQQAKFRLACTPFVSYQETMNLLVRTST